MSTSSEHSEPDIVQPPKYGRVEYRMEHFGDARTDPYHWLRDGRSSEVRKLLRRENAHMESAFAAYGGKRLSRTLYNQMRARWKEDEASLPYRDRSYWYYSRTVPNADHPLFCRRPVSVDSGTFVEEVAHLWAQDPHAPLPAYEDEVVFFDLNLFARELRLDYVELGDMEVSPDEQQLAVTVDCSSGREVFTIFIVEITNVNYEQWLHQHSELGRAWAAAMAQSKLSIYNSPTSALPRYSSSKSFSAADDYTFRTSRKSVSTGDIVDAFQSAPSSSQFTSGAGGVSVGGSERGSTNASVTSADAFFAASAFSRKPAPSHKVKRRIDVFDATDEVLWLSSTTLLYLGLDSRMRSHRVIFHDLTADEDSPHSDVICYEEPNEAFWVSSLCYSADDRFAMFTTSSSGSTQVYVMPCDEGKKRWVSGVPVVHCGFASGGDSDDIRSNGGPTCSTSRTTSIHTTRSNADFVGGGHASAAVHRFTDRAEDVDLDLDHHSSLFGEAIGAWVIVITSLKRGSGHWRVAYVLDDKMLWDESQNLSLCESTMWQTLFTYDPQIFVEGVECWRDYLLLSVRQAASSTVLLLPVRKLWSHWLDNRDSGSSCLPPLSVRHDALDLRAVVCYPLVSVSNVCFSVEKFYQMQWREQERQEFEGGLGESDCVHFVRSCAGDDVFDTRTWRLVVAHPTIPSVTFSCTLGGVEEGEMSLSVKKLYQVPVGGTPFCADDYDATIVWVPSDYGFRSDLLLQMLPTKEPPDVVGIPVYLCWKKSLLERGGNPMFLTVYGSYGECCDVDFESERLALLDRGFVWGAAAVRGGGELGTGWRVAGRKLQRGTTVNDFVSVASFMQKTGWCADGRLVVSGASAGGFVVTAAMNIAPHLFLAVVASVPFVDCLTTLLDPTLPLTVSEWEEFGNPLEDAEAYSIIRALSPMDNIPPPGVALPHIMMLTAWHDTRVGYWESLAFVARLRERREKERANRGNTSMCDGKPCAERAILHYCDFAVGHGGATGRYQRLKEVAREYAFVVLVQEAAEQSST
ncbi:Serine peptidase, Clan SC, Family S9A, putative [Trypanosoma brucei gambiense DAL972]|uniref:Prolyl endopeptidase-like n=1 Tax=Trypanosoma brucei gambiense (strain MHOM/CI/86/DAL972) TaxID=679716 RepID=C9ZPW3_TRYB9|nr:Serine peptidase, Clan SC, Family S9A, putative [Trypanosoma brucei gambiense DAL972]CBH11441.1 Serine peptidase, Clan SC, Family S9A, putative [Trypanosoma brucei gambiense DAL972]|eukprot:XP_011773728.1 Serine peptidase, Clan SC, Family S9A, putative [Trypanosoma brucei gambiense DAL972]